MRSGVFDEDSWPSPMAASRSFISELVAIEVDSGSMPDNSMKRFQIDLREDELRRMEEQASECGYTSKRELINNSLALHEWCVAAARSGRRIVSIDPETKAETEFVSPGLVRSAYKAKAG